MGHEFRGLRFGFGLGTVGKGRFGASCIRLGRSFVFVLGADGHDLGIPGLFMLRALIMCSVEVWDGVACSKYYVV